ncbi:nucleoside/nucleotide kinase family protein [Paenarthrobacter sp. Z7-10]|uniref:nucleoside/nucleotide kinase family protein n=1 Tax=Paenarthrobacter sp. Z7-10 TaxID=2787635 RepID=UPI0022A9D6CD|nr:nucleoside/nucleotide kinase family protein [Paenarthrobacter sp. Z7-10]MCZ2401609.1 nucleoside/nucleotide kinase family protein [Paenarthrobacter sp. Z7-10]
MRKTLYAEFTVKQGCEHRVAELMRELTRQVRQERGNVLFSPYVREANPREYVVFEIYGDEEAFRTHITADYGARFNAALADLVEGEGSALTWLRPADNGIMIDEAGQETLTVVDDLTVLCQRLRSLPKPGGRVLVGITGAPGAGKSTIAEDLAAELGKETAIVVPMDGFHLPTAVLSDPGQMQRRGAIDTFDVDGYLHLLQRLRDRREAVTYAPGFGRDIEEPIAALIPVPREIPVVITEGNYLLSTEPGWKNIRTLLDESWFLEADDTVRVQRLAARHVQFGKSVPAAQAMAEGSDEHNARQVLRSRPAADLVIRLA